MFGAAAEAGDLIQSGERLAGASALGQQETRERL